MPQSDTSGSKKFNISNESMWSGTSPDCTADVSDENVINKNKKRESFMCEKSLCLPFH